MSKETFLIETLTRDVIDQLMEQQGITMRQAMDQFYLSQTFNALTKPETGLYFQSPAYILNEYQMNK
jgi:hypothetical protein